MSRKTRLRKFIFLSLLFHITLISVFAIVFKTNEKISFSRLFEVTTIKLNTGNKIAPRDKTTPDTPNKLPTKEIIKQPTVHEKLNDIKNIKTPSITEPVSNILAEKKENVDNRPSTTEVKHETINPIQVMDTVSEDAYPDYRNNPKPVYPLIARRKGYEGTVMLNVYVLENGSVGEIGMDKSSTHKILDEAAIKAVNKWSFIPGKKNGTVSAGWVKIPIKFQLNDD